MISIQREVSLLPYNTFGVAATASFLVESDNVSELADYVRSLSDPSSVILLGGGSNTLFVSERCGTVVRPVMKGIELTGETDGHVLLRVGAGEIWDDFVKWCVERNFSGVENLSYIPGTAGACPVQNIGAYGSEAKEVIESVEAIEMLTGKTVVLSNNQCRFEYRDSIFKNNRGKYIITAVNFRLSKTFVPNVKYGNVQLELVRDVHITIESVRKAIIKIRRRKLPDPSKTGNAGSFFKNPAIDRKKSEEIKEIDKTRLYIQYRPNISKFQRHGLCQRFHAVELYD